MSTFYLIRIALQDALKHPGCPICHLSAAAARRYAWHLLWENVNDFTTRQRILDGLGFCAPHTRLLAEMEPALFGDPLGLAIIYEHLIQVILERLERLPRPQPRFLKWIARSPLQPAAECALCEIEARNAAYGLQTLFEALEADDERLAPAFQRSDGLCLTHLRQGLAAHAASCPQAARQIVAHTRRHLEAQRRHLSAYIRKHQWQHRHLEITPEEETAWQHALGFFSGLPWTTFAPSEDAPHDE